MTSLIPATPSRSIRAEKAHSNFITLPLFVPHPHQLSVAIAIAIPNVFQAKESPDLLTLVALDHVATTCAFAFAPIVFYNA